MRAVDIIRKKRDGEELSSEELGWLIRGVVDGQVPEYQASAWLMAVYFQGLSPRETASLTRHMIQSGTVLDFSGLGPLVDKHSTGGVGDKISLPLAPLAAACGLKVPMMSGRGLGHTGGTLDKLESINGYSTRQSPESVRYLLQSCGYAMFGQSQTMVPADKILYALRDVTATVESIPLITASILSKKFAEGAEALVFDVKCGLGAFMKDRAGALALARSLVDTAAELGKRAVAVVTSMDEPLGRMVGNWLEVEESIDVLEGRGPADVTELVLRLNAWMLVLGELVSSLEEGLQRGREVLASGRPLELFRQNIRLQGGDPDQVWRERGARRAYCSQVLKADRAGWVQGWDALEVGRIACLLGAGRSRVDDKIQPNAGIEILATRGEYVEAGAELCRLWVDNDSLLEEGVQRLRNAVRLGDRPPTRNPMILEELGPT